MKTVSGVELDSYSTVVDAARCKVYHRNFKEFFDDQIATASCVILSKTQNVDEAKLEADTEIIRELNPDARVITTPWDELSGQAIFDAMTGASSGFPEDLGEDDDDDEDEEHEHDEHEHHHEHDDHDEHEHHHEHETDPNEGLSEGNRIHLGEDEHEHHHHHHHHGEHDADEVFDSIGIETINHYSEEEIRTALSKLGDNIVRAKGIVPDHENGWIFFDFVPGDIDVRRGSPAYTGLITVIGEHVDLGQIKEIFQVK